jgi:transketolase
MTLQTLNNIRELAQQLRVGSVRCTTAAGSGHPTSSMSAADLMAVLLARHLRYHWQRPDNPANDHLIFSKGHASPLLYSMFKAAGVISDEKLINGYRRFGSVLQGHPTPVLPWIDVATGSLGQGLPDGVGVVLAGRYLDELPLPARRPTTRRMGRALTTMPTVVGFRGKNGPRPTGATGGRVTS